MPSTQRTKPLRSAAGRLSLVLLAPLLMSHNGAMALSDGNGGQKITLEGELIEQVPADDERQSNIRDNISAVAVKGKLLVVGADEGADVLVFHATDDPLRYKEAAHCIALDGEDCGAERKGAEVDIEGIAWGEKHLYVVGSHSRARKKAKPDKTPEKNRERLETVKIEPSREQVFRLRLDTHGKLRNKKRISLRNSFANHPILSLFQPIPSKENGLDIEGLAVGKVNGEEALYLGFRGPVLRGNHAMVMVLEFEEGKFKETAIRDEPTIRFLNLGGRGIRGIAEAGSEGFLLLAGPVGDTVTDDPATRYAVYLWDGREDDFAASPRAPLCYVPEPEDAKAEGIELLNSDRAASDAYRLLIVYDGAERGRPTVFECKP